MIENDSQGGACGFALGYVLVGLSARWRTRRVMGQSAAQLQLNQVNQKTKKDSLVARRAMSCYSCFIY